MDYSFSKIMMYGLLSGFKWFRRIRGGTWVYFYSAWREVWYWMQLEPGEELPQSREHLKVLKVEVWSSTKE